MLLFRLGRPGEATAGLEEVLTEDATNPRALIALAERVELEAGRLTDAERRLREVLARDPSRGEGWRALGRLLERAGRSEETIEALRRGLGELPGDGLLHAHLGMALGRLGRLDEAEASLRRAEALLLRVSGRYDEAATGYRAVLERVPTHAKSHFELGLLYLGPLDDRGAAERHLRAAIEAEPDHPRASRARELLASG